MKFTHILLGVDNDMITVLKSSNLFLWDPNMLAHKQSTKTKPVPPCLTFLYEKTNPIKELDHIHPKISEHPLYFLCFLAHPPELEFGFSP